MSLTYDDFTLGDDLFLLNPSWFPEERIVNLPELVAYYQMIGECCVWDDKLNIERPMKEVEWPWYVMQSEPFQFHSWKQLTAFFIELNSQVEGIELAEPEAREWAIQIPGFSNHFSTDLETFGQRLLFMTEEPLLRGESVWKRLLAEDDPSLTAAEGVMP